MSKTLSEQMDEFREAWLAFLLALARSLPVIGKWYR